LIPREEKGVMQINFISKELQHWKSQIVISNADKLELQKPPYAFTEHSLFRAANILKSNRAVKTSN